MDLDSYLQTTDLLDCSGHVTHRLTLLLDGTVQVTFAGGHRAVADPRTQTCLTPGVTIPDTLWPQIAALGA